MRKKISRILIKVSLAFVAISISWVLLYKWAPVKWTPLMFKRSIQFRDDTKYVNNRSWVDLEDVSPAVVRAVIASEDMKFMKHKGFDFGEMYNMYKESITKGTKLRGCSTISQQVAKNCFTFGGPAFPRKLFEAYYTVLIELIWGKERIMEVYLNVAEMGKGIFGIEAAAEKYWRCSAATLSTPQAVSIACILPSPLERDPRTLSTSKRYKRRYANTLKRTKQTSYPFTGKN